MSEPIEIAAGYESLAEVLRLALEQAQGGKGKERHATEQPFVEQPSMADARLLGVAGPVFQARKKLLEAAKCCEVAPERAVADLLGAIVYAAMAVLVIEGRSDFVDSPEATDCNDCISTCLYRGVIIPIWCGKFKARWINPDNQGEV